MRNVCKVWSVSEHANLFRFALSDLLSHRNTNLACGFVYDRLAAMNCGKNRDSETLTNISTHCSIVQSGVCLEHVSETYTGAESCSVYENATIDMDQQIINCKIHALLLY